MKTGRPLDIAIVGMACRFPGARDVARFWENVVAGRDCTSDVPSDRWDPATYHDPASSANDRIPSRRGGFLDSPIEFDPARHGILPEDLAGGDPEQFLVLDAARAALADAGMGEGLPARGRVEVVIGGGNDFHRGNLTRLQHGRVVAQTLAILRELHPEWSERELDSVRADLKSKLPALGPMRIAGPSTNATSGRISDRLGLSGANYVVDAASASSLVALDLGVRALVDRRADLALVGGVYLQAGVDFPMAFSQPGTLSRRGEARPFARDSDGMLPGEGVGVVVLKRLRDAERDGDRIYAVLKGIGVASDDRRRGLDVPSARGHALAIRRAYRRSGLDPATVGFVEGHGIGIPAADRAELRALRSVFPPTTLGRRVLGAVSAQIGHAMPAAGIAALIKAALTLHHRVLPPTPHADRPHRLLEDHRSPFGLAGSARPWIHGGREHPRRAGVNAFGFGGISTHAVLEEHAASADGPDPGPKPSWDSEAILLGARDRGAWIEKAGRLLGWLDREANAAVSLEDFAHTVNTDPDSGPFRVGLMVSSPADLRDRLRSLVGRLADPSCQSIRDVRGTYFWEKPLFAPGTLAFLFPGEGSQYPGMLTDLCPQFPEVRERFDIADRIALEQGLDQLPSDALFGGTKEGESAIWRVGTAIHVVLSAEWALHQVLTGLGLRPDAVVGHSSGEFLALASAGSVSVDREFEDRLGELGRIFERLEGSGRVPTASFVAVEADRAKVERICREIGFGVTVAIDNGPHQVVLVGVPNAVDASVGRLRAQGVMCEPLPFARAYHTPSFAEGLAPIRSFFRELPLRPPSAHVYSCAIACRTSSDVEQIRRVAVEQWALPVAFRSTIERMHADGVRIFVEVGARGDLTGFVEDTLRDRPHFAIAANLPGRSGLTQLNHLTASLFAQGVPLRPEFLVAHRKVGRVDLDRDLPRATPLPALAVGFPGMRISAALAAELRGRATAAVGPEAPSSTVEDPSAPPPASQAEPLPAPPAPPPPQAEPLPAPPAPPPPNPIIQPNGVGKRNDVPPKSAGNAERPARSGAGAAPAPRKTPPRPSVREEALTAHLKTMDAFLESQRQVMGAYGVARTRPQGTPPPVASPRDRRESAGVGPWAGTVRSFVAGRELVSERRLDAKDDPVAEHYTLGGRRVSALDPSRKGLPVVPFTILAEMLVQAAAVLVPGQEVTALRDVQAHQWIRYEEGPATLELRARRDPGRPAEVLVEIHHRRPPVGRAGPPQGPLVEGRIVFGPVRPPGPSAPSFALESPRPCRFTAEEIYADHWLFQGPALQAIAGFGRSSPQGIEGTIRVLPRRGLLEDPSSSSLRIDPIVLDAFAQLLGAWGLDQLPGGEGDVIFPIRVDEVAFFGADPPEGAEVACRIAVRELSRDRVRVDADLVGPDGRIWAQVSGWEDRRFYWPSRYRDHFRRPDEVFVGEPLALPGVSSEIAASLQAVWLEPPADMAKPVWRDVLEWVQLGPEERASAHSQSGTRALATLRLWGRIAAKEAARRLWADRGAVASYPADLAIEFDRRGTPRIRSLAEPSERTMPALSIAYTEGVAVCLAALDPEARPGIDVAPASRDATAELGPGERALLESVTAPGGTRVEWSARFRSAKQAVARAAGLGKGCAPGDAEVVGVDVESGVAAILLGPALIAACPAWTRRNVRVVTVRRGAYVWAWTIGEEG